MKTAAVCVLYLATVLFVSCEYRNLPIKSPIDFDFGRDHDADHPPCPQADPVIIEVSKDATVRSDLNIRMNDNHGRDPFITVGTTREDPQFYAPDGIRTLMEFDVSGFDKPVASAKLQLTMTAGYETGGEDRFTFCINKIIESGDRTPWIEGNGSEREPVPANVVNVDDAWGVAWCGAVDGCDDNNTAQPDFSPEPAAQAELLASDVTMGDIFEIDITSLVNEWITGASPNYGLIMREVSQTGLWKYIFFGSRDGRIYYPDEPDVQDGPRLAIIE